MTQQAEILARSTLPRDWVTGAICPVCGATNLSIEPILDGPDRMVCPKCTFSFEVAADGLHIHPVVLPSALVSSVQKTWYRPGEFRDLIVKAMVSAKPSPEPAPAPANLEPAVLRQRADQLHRLGNSPERIAAVLNQLPGARPEDVAVIVAEIRSAQEKRQRTILRTTYSLIFAVVFIVCALGLFSAQDKITAAFVPPAVPGAAPQGQAPRPPTGNSQAAAPGSHPVPTATSAPNLVQSFVALFSESTPQSAAPGSADTGSNPAPGSSASTDPQVAQAASGDNGFLDPSMFPAPIQTAIPAGAKILKPPPITIEKVAPDGRRTRCPGSAGEAARLFGGDVKAWSAARGGWTLISVEPQIIFVPDGMTVGYLEYIQRPEFFSVPGPARVHNLNFAAVSCE